MGGLVWLASYPKSGNTWTRHFLHNLLEGGDAPYDINQLQGKTTWDSSLHWYASYLPKPLAACSHAEVAAARTQANAAMAEAAGDSLLFAKTHNALVSDEGVPMIAREWTAGAVYIIRNPLDVAVSYSHHLNASIDRTIEWMGTAGQRTNNSERMAYEWLGSWSENVASWTRKRHPALHIMRYEDMLDNPVATFSALVDFLQIAASKRQVGRAIEASSFDKLQAMESRQGFQEKPDNAKQFFRAGQSGQWRESLSKAQVQRILADHGEQMQRFGYSAG
ncbi:MAG: sulfotransferase domain-containing protein [Gammaproteobacteria bacterium]|nr:MAG: sulfotransferase domain-containing protein [Gammaproteobacteria bacterium]